MSVELVPTHRPVNRASRPIQAIARQVRLDPRVTALVPGFDAPFFQAGLAGYSDGAMRLIARRHGCPFCITEALLDRTLMSGGKGRRKENPDLLEQDFIEARIQKASEMISFFESLEGKGRFLTLPERQD